MPHGSFPGWVIPVTSKLVLQWLPCQEPGTTGSALGMVGLVSVYRLGEIESLVCNFCLSVAAHTLVWADPSLRYTSMLLGHKAINKQTIKKLIGNCYYVINYIFQDIAMVRQSDKIPNSKDQVCNPHLSPDDGLEYLLVICKTEHRTTTEVSFQQRLLWIITSYFWLLDIQSNVIKQVL